MNSSQGPKLKAGIVAVLGGCLMKSQNIGHCAFTIGAQIIGIREHPRSQSS